MSDMEDDDDYIDPVIAEITYWLDREEFGLRSYVARETGVTPTSVSDWASGRNRPSREHWEALEKVFGQRFGHLRDVENGKIEPRSTDVVFSVKRRLAEARKKRADPDDRVGRIQARSDEQAKVVRQLQLQVKELGQIVEALGAKVVQLERRIGGPDADVQ